MSGVDLARAQRDMEWQHLRLEMMGVAAQAESAYYDLALADALLEVRGNSVKLAQQVLSDNTERTKQGKTSEVEVLQAQAGLADRRARENEARQLRNQAVNRLLTVLSDEVVSGEESLTIAAAPPIAEFSQDEEEAMEMATRLQPDYLAHLQDIRQHDIRLAFAKNQRWPQIDLVGSYGYNGLGESASDSWSEARGGDYDSWSVGVQFSVGLTGDRKVGADRKVAELRKKQALSKLKEIEIMIHRSVRSGMGECRMLKENIEHIAGIVEVREKLLKVELDRLNAGRGDSRSLFAVEEELLQAREAHARSVNEFEKAVLRLELTTGVTLAKRDLDPQPMREARRASTPGTPSTLGIDQPVMRSKSAP